MVTGLSAVGLLDPSDDHSWGRERGGLTRAFVPFPLSISMLFCAVITCTSVRFYNLPLTQQLSLLYPIKLQSCWPGLSWSQWRPISIGAILPGAWGGRAG